MLAPPFSWTVAAAAVALVATTASQVPRRPSWPFRFAVARRVMRFALSVFGALLINHGPLAHASRRGSELVGSVMGRAACWKLGLLLEPLHLHGLEHLWLRSKAANPTATRVVVLYFHGGAYALQSPRMYIKMGGAILAALQEELEPRGFQVDMLLANYRKTPQHRFPAAAEDAAAIYAHVLETCGVPPSRVIVAGDSAGGGLVLSALLRAKRQGLAMPIAMLLLSPFVDLAKDAADREWTPATTAWCFLPSDFLHAARRAYLSPEKQFANADDLVDMDASPVHCDLRGLPPAIVQTGTLDALYPQAHRLMTKAKSDGVQSWELDEYEDMPHVFMIVPAPLLPQAGVALQRIARFAAKQLGNADEKTTTRQKSD